MLSFQKFVYVLLLMISIFNLWQSDRMPGAISDFSYLLRLVQVCNQFWRKFQELRGRYKFLYWGEMFCRYFLGPFDLRCYLTLIFLNLHLCLNELLRYYLEKGGALKSHTITVWRPIYVLTCSSVSFMNLVSYVWCTDVPFVVTQFEDFQVHSWVCAILDFL